MIINYNNKYNNICNPTSTTLIAHITHYLYWSIFNIICITDQQKKPIIVAKKPKSISKKKKYVKYIEKAEEEAGEFSYIYGSVLVSTLLKMEIKDHAFLPPNPELYYMYSEINKTELEKSLKLETTMNRGLPNRCTEFVQEFWDVFRAADMAVPVSDYAMEIDTCDHPPIAMKNLRHGLHENVIMKDNITVLYNIGHIVRDVLSPWGFHINLAPKSHQEEVNDIVEYVWRFCFNFILLNQLRRTASYPIPRCNDVVMFRFGKAQFFILFDAFSSYH